MKVRFSTEDLSSASKEYLASIGCPWTVVPGYYCVEADIETLSELASIADKIESIESHTVLLETELLRNDDGEVVCLFCNMRTLV